MKLWNSELSGRRSKNKLNTRNLATDDHVHDREQASRQKLDKVFIDWSG